MPILVAPEQASPAVNMMLRSAEDKERAHAVSEWLKARMAARAGGLGVNQLGEYTGIYPSNISRWLNERAIPNPEFCVKLADYFGRPRRELLQLAGHPTGTDETVAPPDLFAAGAEDLTEDEWDDLIDYLEFVKAKRDKKRAQEGK